MFLERLVREEGLQPNTIRAAIRELRSLSGQSIAEHPCALDRTAPVADAVDVPLVPTSSFMSGHLLQQLAEIYKQRMPLYLTSPSITLHIFAFASLLHHLSHP